MKRLPVIDEDRTLVGTVSRKDLLTVFLRKNKDIRAAIVEQVFERGLGIAVTPGPSPSMTARPSQRRTGAGSAAYHWWRT